MNNENDIDILYKRNRESLLSELQQLCRRAGASSPKDRAAALLKQVDALSALYSLKQLKDFNILSDEAVMDFAHQEN